MCTGSDSRFNGWLVGWMDEWLRLRVTFHIANTHNRIEQFLIIITLNMQMENGYC